MLTSSTDANKARLGCWDKGGTACGHTSRFLHERALSRHRPQGCPADAPPHCLAAHPDAGAVRGVPAHGGDGPEQHPGEGGRAALGGGALVLVLLGGEEGLCSATAATAQHSLDFCSLWCTAWHRAVSHQAQDKEGEEGPVQGKGKGKGGLWDAEEQDRLVHCWIRWFGGSGASG